jgi:hypothetical protein
VGLNLWSDFIVAKSMSVVTYRNATSSRLRVVISVGFRRRIDSRMRERDFEDEEKGCGFFRWEVGHLMR